MAGPQNLKKSQNSSFIGGFARGFQHDGWLYLDNSGFLASLGVYLQMFFEFSQKSNFLAHGGSSISKNLK